MATTSSGNRAVLPSRGLKWTTLAKLEESDRGPVYILNKAQSVEGTKGTLLINVPKKNGNGSDLVRIPNTFIPVDLTEQVTRSQLLEAAEFRKAVSNKTVSLLTPEYAAVLLAEPEAKVERSRIANEVSAARAALQGAGVTDEDETFGDEEESGRGRKKAQAKEEDDKPKKKPVNPRIKQLVANADADTWNQTKILAEIRRYGEMEAHELKFLGGSFKDMPRVVDYLRDQHEEVTKGK